MLSMSRGIGYRLGRWKEFGARPSRHCRMRRGRKSGGCVKGQLPLGFVCLNAGVTRAHEDIIAECVARVRNHIGPVAAFKKAVVIERLPKTRSGKILRGIMAGIAQGSEWSMPATIDDPAILEEIRVAVLAIND